MRVGRTFLSARDEVFLSDSTGTPTVILRRPPGPTKDLLQHLIILALLARVDSKEAAQPLLFAFPSRLTLDSPAVMPGKRT